MAATGDVAQQAFAPVLAALTTMQGSVERGQKIQAHAYLEKFQKSVCTQARFLIYIKLRAHNAIV